LARVARRFRVAAAVANGPPEAGVGEEGVFPTRQRADELAAALGEMKGVVMKVAQVASYTNDQLDEQMRAALATLQQQAQPMSAATVAAIVTRELGAPPDATFAQWDPTPIAAASVGQVHRARTHSGEAVAVKVQYPGADEALAADIDTVALLARALVRGPRASTASASVELTSLLGEFKARMVQETDYEREAENQQWVSAEFLGHPYVHVPRVFPSLSSRRVLTTEFATGVRFAEVAAWSQGERDLAGETIFRFHHRCVFVLGRHNADPHPGNYLFHRGGRVTFLDFGALYDVQPGFLSEVSELHAMLTNRWALAVAGATSDDTEVAQPLPTALKPLQWLLEIHAQRGSEFLGHRGPAIPSGLDAPDLTPGSRASSQVLNYTHAVVRALGAQRDWRAIAQEIWPFAPSGEPSTATGTAEAAWTAWASARRV
jgi:hypothetical protein